MGNQYGPYDLAKRVRDMKRGHAVELATVSAVSPLVITIGSASYSANDWPMYECWYEMQDDDVSGNVEPAMIVANTMYNVGDMLAVQQMEGDNAFIILSKVRRVT